MLIRRSSRQLPLYQIKRLCRRQFVNRASPISLFYFQFHITITREQRSIFLRGKLIERHNFYFSFTDFSPIVLTSCSICFNQVYTLSKYFTATCYNLKLNFCNSELSSTEINISHCIKFFCIFRKLSKIRNKHCNLIQHGNFN